MTDQDKRTLSIGVSKWFWRLATEAIRIRSNETYKSEVIADVISDLALARPNPTCETDLLRKHLKTIPSAGRIELTLRIDEAAAANLDALTLVMETQLARASTVTDAISFLFFDYIASHHASKIMSAMSETDNEPN